jgi:hypothetical protein
MAQLKNTNINSTGFLQLPSGTTAQRPASPQNGMTRYNTDLGLVEVFQTTKGWTTFSNFNTPSAAGSTSVLAADTPKDICRSRTSAFNGVYWYRNTNAAGTYQAYTLMDSTYDGGGWTLAFNYDARTGNSMPGGIPHWDNNTFWRDESELNQTNTSPWSVNVKTRAFESIPFDEILFLIHLRNGYSPVSSQVRGWGVYRNSNRVNRGSIRDIVSQGYNLILSSGGRKTGANYAGNLSHNVRRTDQTRGGDPFIDTTVLGVNNANDNLVFNSQGYWGSSARNNTRIATTAGLNNTSRGHTTSGIGIRHGHSGWGYYAGWTMIQAYCGVQDYYGANGTLANNYTGSPESGSQIHLVCDGPYNAFIDAGISVFVR